MTIGDRLSGRYLWEAAGGAQIYGKILGVTRCLSQHQINTALMLVLAGTCAVIVGGVVWKMAWRRPSTPQPFDKRRLVVLGPVLLWFAYVTLSGRWLELVVVVTAGFVVSAAVAVERQRGLAYASAVEMSGELRRGHLIAKFGAPALTVSGFLFAAGALLWVIPADLCR